MPFLDVNEVISDPNFASTFTVLRRVATVNGFGESVGIVVQTIPLVIGIVIPTGANSLVRQDSFETQTNAIEVITEFRLRTASKDAAGINWMPDLVQVDGGTYIVNTSNEFTRFGPGFVVCECDQIDWNGDPASESGTPTSLNSSLASNSSIRQRGWI